MSVHRVGILALIIFIFTAFSTEAQHKFSASKSYQIHSIAINNTADYNPSFGRLSLQFGSGVLFGIGGGAIVGLTAGAAASNKDEPFAGLAYMIGGFYFGYATVSSVGVYLIANSDTYDAQFGSILLGHGIGAAAGFGALSLSETLNIPDGPATLFAFASPLIGGMIANNMSIQKRSAGASALLNINDRNTVVSVPSIQLTRVRNHHVSHVTIPQR